MRPIHLLVIGGGAAGFFCAVNAARLSPGLRVTILEKSAKILSKVRISGGGRCNLTHNCREIPEMMKSYPRGGQFVRRSFHQFFTNDTIDWFESRGVRVKAEADGRMFPVTDSSQTIIDCLLTEANLYGVDILYHADVREISRDGQLFRVNCADERSFEADYLCVACGGYPKSAMFGWLINTGHSIQEPVPSLFTLNLPAHPITKLMGVSIDQARVRVQGMKLEQEGPVLITHWGFSGPAVLRLSAWGARALAGLAWKFRVNINWLPNLSEQDLRERFAELRYSLATQKLVGKNQFGLPNRLWEFLATEAGIGENTRWAELPAKEANKLVRSINAGEFQIEGKTTYKEEFVTAGGIRTEEIDANTMMSKKMSGLYFAGEVIDVDGITGGFNFQHAWSSGFVAAKSIAAAIRDGE